MKTLLVVDMQKGFIKDDDYLALNNKLADLILNNQYDKVIFTKFMKEIYKNSNLSVFGRFFIY